MVASPTVVLAGRHGGLAGFVPWLTGWLGGVNEVDTHQAYGHNWVEWVECQRWVNHGGLTTQAI